MIYWASDYTYIWPDVEARELEEFRKGNLMIEEVNDETASAAAAADSEQQVNQNFFNQPRSGRSYRGVGSGYYSEDFCCLVMVNPIILLRWLVLG